MSQEPDSSEQQARLTRNVQIVLGVVLTVICLLLISLAVLFFGQGPQKNASRIILPNGVSLPQIACSLEQQGVVSNASVFRLGVRLSRQAHKLRAGEYEIPARASMDDVMTLLVTGKTLLHAITIPEGLTIMQISVLLEGNKLLQGNFGALPKEGSWLPETYKVRRGMTRLEFAKLMEKGMQSTLANLWEKRKSHPVIQSKQDALILASIVEKETGLADERPMVASVFLNRLHKKMRLQSDPTIIYGLVGGKGRLGRNIRLSEIHKPTPYNTYVINGLPPSPIANPGRAALESVLNPIESPYLYFVADGTGGHVFAETLEAHNKNVKKWRVISK